MTDIVEIKTDDVDSFDLCSRIQIEGMEGDYVVVQINEGSIVAVDSASLSIDGFFVNNVSMEVH